MKVVIRMCGILLVVVYIVLSFLEKRLMKVMQIHNKSTKKSSSKKVNNCLECLNIIRKCKKYALGAFAGWGLVVVLILKLDDLNEDYGITFSERKVSYFYSENNQRKSLEEAFFCDDTPTPDDVEAEYWEMLDWELYSGEEITDDVLTKYCRKCEAEYIVPAKKEDVKMSDLTPSDQAKVRGLAIKISEYENLESEKTIQQLEDEQKACSDSLKVRPTAEMHFLTGRVSEDLFWKHAMKENNSNVELLKNAAISTENFKEFLTYENRNFQIEGKTQNGYTEDILFRCGKVCYRMALLWNDDDKRIHFLCLAYARMNAVGSNDVCVGTNDVTNISQALGCYYTALICEEMLLYINDDMFYREICERGIAACEEAGRLWELEYKREADSDKNLVDLERILKARLKSAA